MTLILYIFVGNLTVDDVGPVVRDCSRSICYLGDCMLSLTVMSSCCNKLIAISFSLMKYQFPAGKV